MSRTRDRGPASRARTIACIALAITSLSCAAQVDDSNEREKLNESDDTDILSQTIVRTTPGTPSVVRTVPGRDAGRGGPIVTSPPKKDAGTPPAPTPTPSADSDGDGFSDATDNCPAVANPTQNDLDGDAVGYECDANDEVVGRGTLNAWDEKDTLQFDTLTGALNTGIPLSWSARDATSIYVYARAPGLDVAATGVTNFTDITNANGFLFMTDSVVVEVGTVVVLRNLDKGTYGALRLSAVANDGKAWRANMTWVFAGHNTDIASIP
jgi:hypothetical protein